MDKFEKNWFLRPSEQLSVKYFSVFPVFMKLFPKMLDTTKMVSRLKWVKHLPMKILNFKFILAHFIRDIPWVVSYNFGNNFFNSRNTHVLLKSISLNVAYNQIFLNWFIKSWAGFNEQIQEKLTLIVWNRLTLYYPTHSKMLELAAQAWFGKRFKNHWLPIRVVGTRWNWDDWLKTTMNISNRLVVIDLNLILAEPVLCTV